MGNENSNPIGAAVEWARNEFNGFEHWPKEAHDHYRRRSLEKNYDQGIVDHCKWHRENMPTPQVKNLTDTQIDLVADCVLADSHIPNIFARVLGVPVENYDYSVHAAIQWVLRDMSGVANWPKEGKDHHRQRSLEGNYRQSVIDHCRWHRANLPTPQVKHLTDAQIDQVADRVAADSFLPVLFSKELGAPAKEPDRVTVAVSWCRRDFQGMMHWPEAGKEHHRNHQRDGNYRQSVIDHCRHHRDNLLTKQVKGLSDEQINQVADRVAADNHLRDLFDRALGSVSREEVKISSASLSDWPESALGIQRELQGPWSYYRGLGLNHGDAETKPTSSMSVEAAKAYCIEKNYIGFEYGGDGTIYFKNEFTSWGSWPGHNGMYLYTKQAQTNDPAIPAVVEWCKNDFQGISNWPEEGKNHHKMRALEGNYRQSVIDHCRFHRDHLHTGAVANLTNDQIDTVADRVTSDNFLPDLFNRTLGVSAQESKVIPRLVLVDKNSPRALVFENKPDGIFALTLTGAFKGLGLVNLHEGTKQHEEWSYTEIGIGRAENAVRARFDEKFCRRESDGLTLDVAFWQYKEGNHVNWVGGQTEEKTRQHGGGRDFIPSPHAAQGLPYLMICGGNQNFALGCDMDPEKLSQIFSNTTSTDTGNRSETNTDTGSRSENYVIDEPAYDDGPSLVLVPRGSPRQCIFEHAEEWFQDSFLSRPLTLANHDLGVVSKNSQHLSFGELSVKRLGLGQKHKAMNVNFRDQFIVRTEDNDVLGVDNEELAEEQALFMQHHQDSDRTFNDRGKGCLYEVNSDGTISLARAPGLCLGFGSPRLILVPNSSPQALFFKSKPEGEFRLSLTGLLEGYSLVNKYQYPRFVGEVRYTDITIGKEDDAVSAHFDERFLRREGDGLALDVAYWQYVEGNEVNWVGEGTEEGTRRHGGGRDWIPDAHSAYGIPYMITCGGGDKNLVLGCDSDPQIYNQLLEGTSVSTPGKTVEITLNTFRGIQKISVSDNLSLEDFCHQARSYMLPDEDRIMASFSDPEGQYGSGSYPHTDPGSDADVLIKSGVEVRVNTYYGEKKIVLSGTATVSELFDKVRTYVPGESEFPFNMKEFGN